MKSLILNFLLLVSMSAFAGSKVTDKGEKLYFNEGRAPLSCANCHGVDAAEIGCHNHCSADTNDQTDDEEKHAGKDDSYEPGYNEVLNRIGS